MVVKMNQLPKMPPKKAKKNNDDLPESSGKTNPPAEMSSEKSKTVENPMPESAVKKKRGPRKPKVVFVKKAPKKRAPRKPKVVVVKKPPPENPKELSQDEADELLVDELARVALKRYFDKMGNMAKQAEDPFNKYLTEETKHDYETLAIILGEYLDSFVIVGYRPDGELLSMRKYHNARDKMALEKTIQHLAMGQI